VHHPQDQGARINEPAIQLAAEPGRSTLTIADNGAGMTEEELHQNLATIGESFTRLQRDELRARQRRGACSSAQFGIGLLSAFSISKRWSSLPAPTTRAAPA